MSAFDVLIRSDRVFDGTRFLDHHDAASRGSTIVGAAAADVFVADRIAEGSDYIKAVRDDFSHYPPVLPTLGEETLRAVVNAAHRHRALCVVHVGGLDDARAAVVSGADCLGHWVADG